jgi:SNF2 family DNA or RNA helicase
MVEGNRGINNDLITRLHSIMRPFLLRRLKKDVEKQLPGKFEHIVMCKLSRRQQFLYEEFMSRSSTRSLLSGANYMGMMNILMQLRKVCILHIFFYSTASSLLLCVSFSLLPHFYYFIPLPFPSFSPLSSHLPLFFFLHFPLPLLLSSPSLVTTDTTLSRRSVTTLISSSQDPSHPHS